MTYELVEKDLTAEDLFRRAQELVRQAQELTVYGSKLFGKYSPFDYFASKWKYELADVRKSLITARVEQLRQKYMPWIRLERVPGFEGFETLMDKADEVGRENYDDSVIENWFLHYANVPNWTALESRRQILDRARHFVPWVNAEPAKDVKEIWDGRCTLKLHAYFWNATCLHYDINSERKFEALEKVMRMAIREEAAEIVPPDGPLARHVNKTRDTEELKRAFFETQQLPRATPFGDNFDVFLESFTCYKNGHFYLRFRNATFARQVAELLIPSKGSEEHDATEDIPAHEESKYDYGPDSSELGGSQ